MSNYCFELSQYIYIFFQIFLRYCWHQPHPHGVPVAKRRQRQDPPAQHGRALQVDDGTQLAQSGPLPQVLLLPVRRVRQVLAQDEACRRHGVQSHPRLVRESDS